MGCIALVRCVLVLRCGLAVMVWYPYAGWGIASACIRIPHHHRQTVRHLDSWIKKDQLDVTCFIISLFNAQHVSDVNTSETCWPLNKEIIKQVPSSWSISFCSFNHPKHEERSLYRRITSMWDKAKPPNQTSTLLSQIQYHHRSKESNLGPSKR